jgi:protein-tyrosine phosphatase
MTRAAAASSAAAADDSGSQSTMRVLFVCTGNICRSPSAEGVLRARLAALGLERAVVVESCGTHGYHEGDPPDSRAIRAGRRRGYDISGLRARAWCADDADAFDLVVAMEEHHARWVGQRLRPGARTRVVRLLDYAPHLPVRDVPDPWYGGDRDFEAMYDLIETAIDGLVAEIAEALAVGR